MGRIKVGFELIEGAKAPLFLNWHNQNMWLITAPSGSGKSVLMLYILNSLIEILGADSIWIADFKSSGSYKGIVSHYAEGSDVTDFFNAYYDHYLRVKDGLRDNCVFIFEEQAGFLNWLNAQDKKQAQEMKDKISVLMMTGRSLKGGSCGLITILQRADASNFSNGARENYMVKVLLGTPSAESKTMLGFYKDDIPEDFKGGIGKGLIMTSDNSRIRSFQVPFLDEKRLKNTLIKKAHSNKGLPPSRREAWPRTSEAK